jgi:hypothetical protein
MSLNLYLVSGFAFVILLRRLFRRNQTRTLHLVVHKGPNFDSRRTRKKEKGAFTLEPIIKMSLAAKLTRPGPMTFVGRVTKAGVMNKTVTVTVDRIWVHPKTHKVH